MNIDLQQAESFLTQHYHGQATHIEHLGAGAWSRCYGFRLGAEELVIRFGNYVEDFQKDQLAYRYASADLPIPEVREIGPAFDGYYAIGTRVYGAALESATASDWQATIPALVTTLEALRTADISSTRGWGGWGSDQIGAQASWSAHLLALENDNPAHRTHGWRERLKESAEGEASFIWGLDLLKRMVSDAVPRCLLHCDLINNNVFVRNHAISGVFDWGCSLYGDHLYELAWFEFWAPWSPELDIKLLRTALEQRWREVGYIPTNKAQRLAVCYLHIGLDHLAYNAYCGRWSTLLETAAQMRALVKG